MDQTCLVQYGAPCGQRGEGRADQTLAHPASRENVTQAGALGHREALKRFGTDLSQNVKASVRKMNGGPQTKGKKRKVGYSGLAHSVNTALILQIRSSIPQGDEEQALVLNCLGPNGLHSLEVGSRASD